MLNSFRARGWAGVDLFFVLSGFLITGILFDTRDDSRFFQRFFVRRALRILPVFYLIVFVLLAMTPFVHYQWRAGHLLFLVYMGNFAANQDFSLYSILSPSHPHFEVFIGHFWSLCVEEQFYLIWPLAVWFIRDRVRLIQLALVLCVASLLLRCGIFMAGGAQLAERWTYRTLFSHMDPLLIGSVLALLLRGANADRWQRLCRPVGLLFGTLAVVVLFSSSVWGSPWVLTIGLSLMALGWAGLVGCTLREGSFAFQLFKHKLLRPLGRYSYGFYMYHVLFAKAWGPPFWWMTSHFHSLAIGGGLWLVLLFTTIFFVSKYSYDLFESKFLRLKRYFEYDSEISSHKHAFLAK